MITHTLYRCGKGFLFAGIIAAVLSACSTRDDTGADRSGVGSTMPLHVVRDSAISREEATARTDDHTAASLMVTPGQVEVIESEQILAADIATGAVTTDEILSMTIPAEDIGYNQVTKPRIVQRSRSYETGSPDPSGLLNEQSGRPQENGRTGDVPFDGLPTAGEESISEEEYQDVAVDSPTENAFRSVSGSPYSTFSIDVDHASYTMARGNLNAGILPDPSLVRIEEMINYFRYDYPEPSGDHPFAFNSEVIACPWNREHLLVRLGLQGVDVHPEQAPPSNLVFLIDVSGSMATPDKLPLLKQAFEKLIAQLRPQDRVAIVVYAGAAGEVLASTPGSDKAAIRTGLNSLNSGGSTAGGAGIELAYKVAADNMLPNGNNRVILATDGDFNVGISTIEGLQKLIEAKREKGIFLSVLGFGLSGYGDQIMETLADHGNGNYYMIDKLAEAERVLSSEMAGTLYAIAKDVKIQIRFNSSAVAAYRLIGYENRVLAARDFDDDRKDAGELGAGHQVTALYEIVPVGASVGFEVDEGNPEDYALDEDRPELLTSDDLFLARLRYKKPDETTSRLIEHIIRNKTVPEERAGSDTKFAAAVAAWGMLLRRSAYAGSATYEMARGLARESSGSNHDRKELLELISTTQLLDASAHAVGSR